jgi:hypothetical protein
MARIRSFTATAPREMILVQISASVSPLASNNLRPHLSLRLQREPLKVSPEWADVVIVAGGTTGASRAYFLMKKGMGREGGTIGGVA